MVDPLEVVALVLSAVSGLGALVVEGRRSALEVKVAEDREGLVDRAALHEALKSQDESRLRAREGAYLHLVELAGSDIAACRKAIAEMDATFTELNLAMTAGESLAAEGNPQGAYNLLKRRFSSAHFDGAKQTCYGLSSVGGLLPQGVDGVYERIPQVGMVLLDALHTRRRRLDRETGGTPQSEEDYARDQNIIDSYRHGSWEKAKQNFDDACREWRREVWAYVGGGST